MKIYKSIVCAIALLAAVSCGNSAGTPAGSKCGNRVHECSGNHTGDCKGGDDCTGECADCQGGGSGECSGECENKGAGECTGNCEYEKKSECALAGNAAIATMMARRSIRKYKPQIVDRKVMGKILECGINAPNGQNKQSWEVRVVDNPALMNEIKDAMVAGGNAHAADCFRGAPVMVFIARDKSYDFSTIDCGLLAGNMVNAATSLGVGSICLGSPVRFIETSPKRDEVLSRLSFSPGYELCLCIGFGYPDEAPDAKPRDYGKVKYVD